MNKTTGFLLVTASALMLAGSVSAQGLGAGGLGGGVGAGAGGGLGGLGGAAGIGGGVGMGGIGAGRLDGQAGAVTRGDAAINNRASMHAADQAGVRADVHSPVGSTVHGKAKVSGEVDSPGVTQREGARSNRQGPAHAADRAVANANANAGLATQATTSNPLAGLATGLVVKDSTGVTLGKVSRIQRSSDGTVRNVLVAGADGRRRTIRLAPDSLSVSSGVVTTTQVNP